MNASGPMPYEDAAPNAYRWTELAYEMLVNGTLTVTIRSAADVRTAVVDGRCPRCGDLVTVQQILDAVLGEAPGVLGEATPTGLDVYVPLTLSCNCREEHPGRPDGRSGGCGINFRVDVRLDDADE